MQLLEEAWLPVRCRDGTRRWITPSELSDHNVVAFDANRADFNGALAQFAIGLLQTTAPIRSNITWRKLFNSPPDSATLQTWFAAVASAFQFDGQGARFMQDLDLTSSDGASCEIGALLIDSPGDNALRNNTDHFIKRNRVAGMCPHCAATALFTLQTNAPSGGAGHRTGLRGGGPLTTLLMNAPSSERSLWHDLWLNVFDEDAFLALGGDESKTAPQFTFPWLASLSTLQKEGGETAPSQVHPAHIYWAMPRRIRLDFDAPESEVSAICGICGRATQQLLTHYVTKNYGMNYKGLWNHPLSPYYLAKEERLPLHPQPGGLGYRHWLAWVLGMANDKKAQQAAAVVRYALNHRSNQIGGALRLWAFGYDMDNMKPRCWYESSLPLYGLADIEPKRQDEVAKLLEREVGMWLNTAELALSMLRGAIKDAWFGGEARGDYSHIDSTFWSATEPSFYRQLHALLEQATQPAPADPEAMLLVRQTWLAQLQTQAKDLFDGVFVGAGQVEHQNPARLAKAWQQLLRNINGPKILSSAGLPAKEAAPKVPSKKAAKPNKEPA